MAPFKSLFISDESFSLESVRGDLVRAQSHVLIFKSHYTDELKNVCRVGFSGQSSRLLIKWHAATLDVINGSLWRCSSSLTIRLSCPFCFLMRGCKKTGYMIRKHRIKRQNRLFAFLSQVFNAFLTGDFISGPWFVPHGISKCLAAYFHADESSPCEPSGAALWTTTDIQIQKSCINVNCRRVFKLYESIFLLSARQVTYFRWELLGSN